MKNLDGLCQPLSSAMDKTNITADEFQAEAVKRFAFLESHGFRHAPELDETFSTFGTVVYLGNHMGFVFSLDVRDQCIDGYVAKVFDGKIRRNWDGGYYSDIISHLIKYAGFRGKLGCFGKGKRGEELTLEMMLDAWGELLQQHGQSLLEDRADALPK